MKQYNVIIRWFLWSNNILAKTFGWIPGYRRYMAWTNRFIVRHRKLYTTAGIFTIVAYSLRALMAYEKYLAKKQNKLQCFICGANHHDADHHIEL